MKLTVKQSELLIPFVDALRSSKPTAEYKIDIKLFIMKFDEILNPTRSQFRQLIDLHNESIIDCSEEEKKLISDRLNAHLNSLYANEVEIPSFNPEWLQFVDLTVQDEINIESLLKDLEA